MVGVSQRVAVNINIEDSNGRSGSFTFKVRGRYTVQYLKSKIQPELRKNGFNLNSNDMMIQIGGTTASDQKGFYDKLGFICR